LTITPASRTAIARALSLSLLRTAICGAGFFFTSHGVTSAVRRPESRDCTTHPVVPSASRTWRQPSNSLTTSSGKPACR
jgi:hypothetical protein